MPRKAFVADLQEAVGSTTSARLSNLKAGDEDGTITFTYNLGTDYAEQVTIQALVPDVSDYPSDHQFLIFSTSENASIVDKALEKVSGSLVGTKIATMLAKVSRALDKAVTESPSNPVNLSHDPMDIDEEEPEYSDGEDDDVESTGAWSPRSPRHGSTIRGTPRYGKRHTRNESSMATHCRIRSDLRAAKGAGFKVGHLGALLDDGQASLVSISCRIAKLGISDEAMQAWHLDRRQYLIFLIHYTAGYMPLEVLTAKEASHSRGTVEMRVGVSDRYKPSYAQAITAFSQIPKKEDDLKLGNSATTSTRNDDPSKEDGFHGLFNDGPLNELLNERLFILLRSRLSLGIGWGGAEDFYNDCQGRTITNADALDSKYWNEAPPKTANALPQLVLSDHLTELTPPSLGHSFPLLGMQFVLRHLVRCTEFCLVCHCKVEADFEALKPYVCSKPLCLYQYMTLGFGPSIEYEILTQPYVVDLLISFCYASAKGGRLRDFPVGMALTVPPPRVLIASDSQSTGLFGRLRNRRTLPAEFAPVTGLDGTSPGTSAKSLVGAQTVCAEASRKPYKVNFDRTNMEILFSDATLEDPLRTGDWIVLDVPGVFPEEGKLHCRVIETACFPTVRLGPPVNQSGGTTAAFAQHFMGTPRAPELTPAATPPCSSSIPAAFTIYNQHFDELSEVDRRESICMLLETLPNVKQMREYLRGRKSSLDLEGWVDRVSPAARGVLRWIIASNRSCIVQVDDLDGKEKGLGSSLGKPEQRVHGMGQWMQFRFAQGAPDKEQRFVNSVREATERLHLKYPTIFAWHGSSLQNWHGIVREGLHFEETLHGRAFGDGCYHAMDSQTSSNYSTIQQHGAHLNGGWPHSQLKILSALALNEIVNAPKEFVSKTPYLVVSQLDWIQARYLFVKCNVGDMVNHQDTIPAQVYEQDPAYTPRGDNNDRIIMPITAVSKSRRPSVKGIKTGNKKTKILSRGDEEMAQRLEDDAASVVTDMEDSAILLSDTEESDENREVDNGKGRIPADLTAKKAVEVPKSDFLPGLLDQSTLPLLEAPVYATPMATQALQRELASTLKAQSTQPAHELGWYINPELINNIYQWIIELHSFEVDLPLANDLKAKGLKSVVMEIRFGKDYPHSPPFVRVIRPRFVSFMAGGGGHVTAGGALCMELLTNSGWSAVSPIESVLLQVRLAISSTDPKPARLESGPVRDYGVGEAVEAYLRACVAHGWKVPEDFHAFNAPARGTFHY
ncbi:MAG: hypothetical protein M1830_007060 [Pleopsidium flavum]|nr:MAG: hypothetical protein M1830_007060 [Pleopsidium flavum]